MKVFTLTLVAMLLVCATSAAKIRRGEKRIIPSEEPKSSEDEVKTEITGADSDKREKEVHKRGIFHYGGVGNLAASSSLWPKTYASHYGYGWPAASGFSVAPLAGSHVHSPAVLKHNSGFHYKALAAPTLLSSGVHASVGPAFPTYASLTPAVAHVHQPSAAQPFIIRPGGAIVQSYSVTYPRQKPAVAVKPIHAFASVPPIHHVTPIQAVQPGQHTYQTVGAVQPVQHIEPVAAVQPLQTVQTVAAVQPVQPVHHLHPISPVQSIVQTSFVQSSPLPAIPQRPPVGFTPAQTVFPAIPTFPNPPAFPSIPAIPASPSPSVPSVPAIPAIPTIPSIPNFPQPQLPSNNFFPVNVQPPLSQQPPAFGNINPSAQFPAFGPIAGNSPDSGSAEASPQIPVSPSPSPEPELPEPTQQPWKPILYQPSTVQNSLNRPSNTLLPPYGNSPAEGYLPPVPSSNNHKLQQEYTIGSNLFDNLSDADIQEIFSQANLAAQHDRHHHHTVHQYHTRF